MKIIQHITKVFCRKYSDVTPIAITDIFINTCNLITHCFSVAVTDYNYIYFLIKLHNFRTCIFLLPKTADGRPSKSSVLHPRSTSLPSFWLAISPAEWDFAKMETAGVTSLSFTAALQKAMDGITERFRHMRLFHYWKLLKSINCSDSTNCLFKNWTYMIRMNLKLNWPTPLILIHTTMRTMLATTRTCKVIEKKNSINKRKNNNLITFILMWFLEMGWYWCMPCTNMIRNEK